MANENKVSQETTGCELNVAIPTVHEGQYNMIAACASAFTSHK